MCIRDRSVAYQFNRDTIGSLTEKEAAQRQMVDDIIAVADQVRKGTENAMNIVNELNSSTEVVNGAMKDISDSTQSTAENIQTQTEMTPVSYTHHIHTFAIWLFPPMIIIPASTPTAIPTRCGDTVI